MLFSLHCKNVNNLLICKFRGRSTSDVPKIESLLESDFGVEGISFDMGEKNNKGRF